MLNCQNNLFHGKQEANGFFDFSEQIYHVKWNGKIYKIKLKQRMENKTNS